MRQAVEHLPPYAQRSHRATLIWQLSVLACLGVLGGVLSSMVGVGSGIIFLAALIYVAGWNIEQAAAIFVVIFFAALSSILRNTSGESPVDWRAAALLSAAIVPSSLIGVVINRVVPGAVVKIAFAGLLLAVAYLIAARGQERSEHTRPSQTPPRARPSRRGGDRGPVRPRRSRRWSGDRSPAHPGPRSASEGRCRHELGRRSVHERRKCCRLRRYWFPPNLGLAATDIVGAVLGTWFGVRLRDRTPDAPLQIGFALLMVIVASQLFIDATNILKRPMECPMAMTRRYMPLDEWRPVPCRIPPPEPVIPSVAERL